MAGYLSNSGGSNPGYWTQGRMAGAGSAMPMVGQRRDSTLPTPDPQRRRDSTLPTPGGPPGYRSPPPYGVSPIERSRPSPIGIVPRMPPSGPGRPPGAPGMPPRRDSTLPFPGGGPIWNNSGGPLPGGPGGMPIPPRRDGTPPGGGGNMPMGNNDWAARKNDAAWTGGAPPWIFDETKPGLNPGAAPHYPGGVRPPLNPGEQFNSGEQWGGVVGDSPMGNLQSLLSSPAGMNWQSMLMSNPQGALQQLLRMLGGSGGGGGPQYRL